MSCRPDPRPPIVVFGYDDVKADKNDNFLARSKFCTYNIKVF